MFLRRLTAVWVIGLMCCHVQGFSYDPPVGIPEPIIDVETPIPQKPSVWDHEIPGFYYIDYENGSDSTNTYGYPEHPRKTLPSTIPAGSYVEVHGIYRYAAAGAIWIHGEGSADEWEANERGPVWIVGEDSASFSNLKTIVYGQNVYVDNILFASVRKCWCRSSCREDLD